MSKEIEDVNRWDIPEFLRTELEMLETRMDKAVKFVEKHKDEIHPSISFIQAIELYDMGLDVTQLKPKNENS